jgi:hypothetical protein
MQILEYGPHIVSDDSSTKDALRVPSEGF